MTFNNLKLVKKIQNPGSLTFNQRIMSWQKKWNLNEYGHSPGHSQV